MKYYLNMWKFYAKDSGRTDRIGFWVPTLINVIFVAIMISIIILGGYKYTPVFSENNIMDGFSWTIYIIVNAYFLSIIIPTIAMIVRRLHDVGFVGWMWLIICVPYVGSIALIILLVFPSGFKKSKYLYLPKM